MEARVELRPLAVRTNDVTNRQRWQRCPSGSVPIFTRSTAP